MGRHPQIIERRQILPGGIGPGSGTQKAVKPNIVYLVIIMTIIQLLFKGKYGIVHVHSLRGNNGLTCPLKSNGHKNTSNKENEKWIVK